MLLAGVLVELKLLCSFNSSSVLVELKLLCSFSLTKTPAGSNVGEYYQIL